MGVEIRLCVHNYHFHNLWRDNVPGIQWVSRSVLCAQLSFASLAERQDGLAKFGSCFVHFDYVMSLLVLVCHLCVYCSAISVSGVCVCLTDTCLGVHLL